jgi:hypothetical protein
MKSFKDLSYPAGLTWEDFFTPEGGLIYAGGPRTDAAYQEGFAIAKAWYDAQWKAEHARAEARRKEEMRKLVKEAIDEGVEIKSPPYDLGDSTGYNVRAYSAELGLTLIAATYSSGNINWDRAVLAKGKCVLGKKTLSWMGRHNDFPGRTTGTVYAE